MSTSNVFDVIGDGTAFSPQLPLHGIHHERTEGVPGV